MRIAIALLSLAPLAGAQSRPAFEVASFKVATAAEAPQQGRPMGVRIDGSQAQFDVMPLKTLLTRAFRLANFQVIGPDWMDSTFYNIRAKLPEGAQEDQVPEMLQSLLVERLKLKFHFETRETWLNALVTAKDGTKPPPTAAEYDKSKFRSVTMSSLAHLITQALERSTTDETNLTGEYLIPADRYRAVMMKAIQIKPAGGSTADLDDGVSELLKSTGLRIESRKQSLKMLVVDHAEKTPTEN